MGVRISWLMEAKNELFARASSSAGSLLSCNRSREPHPHRDAALPHEAQFRHRPSTLVDRIEEGVQRADIQSRREQGAQDLSVHLTPSVAGRPLEGRVYPEHAVVAIENHNRAGSVRDE